MELDPLPPFRSQGRSLKRILTPGEEEDSEGSRGIIYVKRSPALVTDAPWISTFVAIALIPVAFLFTHSYISGKKRLAYHSATGSIAIVWDLSLSVFYMLYRVIGGEVEESTLDVSGALLAYFIAHGIIAVIVIVLEVVLLATGLLYLFRKKASGLHNRIAPYLLVVWFAAFLSGEVVYLVNYVL